MLVGQFDVVIMEAEVANICVVGHLGDDGVEHMLTRVFPDLVVLEVHMGEFV